MKRSQVVVLIALAPLLFATTTWASPITKTAPPFIDGFYSIKGTDTTTTNVELFVGDHGTRIVGGLKGSGVVCAPSADAAAAGAELILDLFFPLHPDLSQWRVLVLGSGHRARRSKPDQR